ncbi:hypothetical protein AMECASPLE_014472 [Ameca splendens]|uniref:Uncharacterized protein n=1 Tax=Ameca splendens TaxID=208324 RepID=A0ABV0XEQ3_9TELE
MRGKCTRVKFLFCLHKLGIKTNFNSDSDCQQVQADCQNGVLGRTKVQRRARQQHVVKVFNSLLQRLPKNEAKTLQVQTISRRSKNSQKYTLQEHGNTKNIFEGSERKEPAKNNQNQRAYKQRGVRYEQMRHRGR